MTKPSLFKWFKMGPEITRLAILMYVRFPLSLRNVEDLLRERSAKTGCETVRFWWLRFKPLSVWHITMQRRQSAPFECVVDSSVRGAGFRSRLLQPAAQISRNHL